MNCEACGMFIRKGMIVEASDGSVQYFCCKACRDTYQCERDEALKRFWKKVG